MYTRYHVWQDSTIQTITENGWENIIVMGVPSIDFRFKLKGYGWKPSISDTNLVVLHEGRYECYYRERFATTWEKFSTVISERASTDDSTVYKDTFVSLGVVDDKVYEFRIVAVDAQRFASWGGVIEGIESSTQFWHSDKMRSARPYKIQVSDRVKVRERLLVG